MLRFGKSSPNHPALVIQMLTSQAIVLNRTKIYTSGRRNLNLNFAVRLALRIGPILLFLAHAQSLLQAMRCQTSPSYPLLKYGNPDKHFDLDFAADGGLLYRLSSALLFWQDDSDSCRAARWSAALLTRASEGLYHISGHCSKHFALANSSRCSLARFRGGQS